MEECRIQPPIVSPGQDLSGGQHETRTKCDIPRDKILVFPIFNSGDSVPEDGPNASAIVDRINYIMSGFNSVDWTNNWNITYDGCLPQLLPDRARAAA